NLNFLLNTALLQNPDSCYIGQSLNNVYVSDTPVRSVRSKKAQRPDAVISQAEREGVDGFISLRHCLRNEFWPSGAGISGAKPQIDHWPARAARVHTGPLLALGLKNF